MNRPSRRPRILVTCGGRIPSVELGAIIPLAELQKRSLCVFEYKDEARLSLDDIVWCDILFIVRGISSQSVWAAKQAKDLGRLVLGYWDDSLLSVPSLNPHHAYLTNPIIRSNMQTLFGLTDNFFSPSSKLADKLAALHGRRVEVLPVPLGAEELKPPKRRIHPIPTVGYATSPDHAAESNLLLIPAAAALTAIGTKFRLHVIGPETKLTLQTAMETVYTPYIRDYSRYVEFASRLEWDLGLAPQFDNEFTTYKFYNKLLEYTHIGCAGIYSKLEPYTGVIQDGVTGLLVNNEIDAWKDAILRLLQDPEMRFRIATNAFEYVQSHHNREVIAEGYSAARPLLTYRAPPVGRAYVVTRRLASRLSLRWKSGTEYIKIHGIRRFIPAAARHLFSSMHRKGP